MTKRTWTSRRRQAVEAWIEQTKVLMGLAAWTIRIDWDGNEETRGVGGDAPDATATISYLPMSKHAVIAVARELLDLDPSAQQQTLVHELYHCHFFALHEYADNAFNVAVKDNEIAQDMFDEGLNQHVEIIVDGLADNAHLWAPKIDLS